MVDFCKLAVRHPRLDSGLWDFRTVVSANLFSLTYNPIEELWLVIKREFFSWFWTDKHGELDSPFGGDTKILHRPPLSCSIYLLYENFWLVSAIITLWTGCKPNKLYLWDAIFFTFLLWANEEELTQHIQKLKDWSATGIFLPLITPGDWSVLFPSKTI